MSTTTHETQAEGLVDQARSELADVASTGEMSHKVVDAAREIAGDALESGKPVAADAADTAKEQSRELASNPQERAHESLASQTG